MLRLQGNGKSIALRCRGAIEAKQARIETLPRMHVDSLQTRKKIFLIEYINKLSDRGVTSVRDTKAIGRIELYSKHEDLKLVRVERS
jgi:hypothetical protein